MVLICDNAAYHHAREIGSLGSMKKNDLIALCIKYSIEYIDLPLNSARHEYIENSETLPIEILDDNNCRVAFNAEEMGLKACGNNPFIPTSEELKYGMLEYMKEHLPHLLECKVEKYLRDEGDHIILWTPPYSPDLQPIELFWAAGKNHAAAMTFAGIKMRETIDHLREGWYGNHHCQHDVNGFVDGDYERRKKDPVDCAKLFRKVVRMINEKFIPMCVGISGTLGELTVDHDHIAERTGVPVDILIADLIRNDEESIENDDIFGEV